MRKRGVGNQDGQGLGQKRGTCSPVWTGGQGGLGQGPKGSHGNPVLQLSGAEGGAGTAGGHEGEGRGGEHEGWAEVTSVGSRPVPPAALGAGKGGGGWCPPQARTGLCGTGVQAGARGRRNPGVWVADGGADPEAGRVKGRKMQWGNQGGSDRVSGAVKEVTEMYFRVCNEKALAGDEPRMRPLWNRPPLSLHALTLADHTGAAQDPIFFTLSSCSSKTVGFLGSRWQIHQCL